MDSRLTKTEFIELVASTRSNRALAERLEELGVNENLSHFVRANTAFNEGRIERVFAECDIDLLIAELRDVPGWFWSSSRLIRQLEKAREALAVLGNRKATAEEKKQAEAAIVKAWYPWWSLRTKILLGFWRGVRRAPERFYDRSADAFSGAGKCKPVDESASAPRPQTPLVAIFKYGRAEMNFWGIHFLIGIPLVELKGYCKRIFATDVLMYNITTFSLSVLILVIPFALHWKFRSKFRIDNPLDAPLLPEPNAEGTP